MEQQGFPDLSPEDEEGIERAIWLELIKAGGRPRTAAALRPLIPGGLGMRVWPESVINRVLESMVEKGRIWANRGIAHTTYQSKAS